MFEFYFEIAKVLKIVLFWKYMSGKTHFYLRYLNHYKNKFDGSYPLKMNRVVFHSLGNIIYVL